MSANVELPTIQHRKTMIVDRFVRVRSVLGKLRSGEVVLVAAIVLLGVALRIGWVMYAHPDPRDGRFDDTRCRMNLCIRRSPCSLRSSPSRNTGLVSSSRRSLGRPFSFVFSQTSAETYWASRRPRLPVPANPVQA